MTVTELKQKSLNQSGIRPVGDRLLVRPDTIEETSNSVIELPPEVQMKYQTAQCAGVVIASGIDAYKHHVERIYHRHDNGVKEFVEERVREYSQPFAKPGDRVSFAKHAGRPYTGKDGEYYVIINDEDITCLLDDDVVISDIDPRKGLGL
jgi:co-chaperonin GroES (HSP10)